MKKEEDKKKYTSLMQDFEDFLKGEETMMLFEKLPKFFINYFINNLDQDLREKLYFNFRDFDGY